MKTIAIYFSDPEPMGYPFNDRGYWSEYSKIVALVAAAGHQVVFVRGNSYQGSGTFSHGWRVSNGILEKVEPVKADLIVNRDSKNTVPIITDCPIINQPEIDSLCLDKLATAKMFFEVSPRTATAYTYDEYLRRIAEWQILPAETIVLKRNFGNSGENIFILPSGDVRPDLYADWHDVLLQEYLDGTIGVPGVAEGVHDLRVNIVNGEMIDAYVRQPAPGEYLANVAQGGSSKAVAIADLPTDVVEICNLIGNQFRQYHPAVYAVDCMNTTKGVKLIELNSRPGLWYEFPDNPFTPAIAKLLINTVNN